MNESILQIENLKQDIECETFCVRHFYKEMNRYNINIICYEFSSNQDLKDNWEIAMNNVAMYIQSKVSEVIEMYNIYLLFFCKDINAETRNIIEQNKYSSRKIIISKEMPDDINELEKIISRRLFEFDFTQMPQNNEIVQRCIEENSPQLYKYLKENETISEEDLKMVIEELRL